MSKAWKVECPDGLAVVVHAETRGRARSLGASELGYQWEYMDYRATRFPAFDNRRVSPLALIGEGWWWQCGACQVVLDEERINDDELEPVESGHDLFCGQGCLDYLRAQQEKFQRQIRRWKQQLANATKGIGGHDA